MLKKEEKKKKKSLECKRKKMIIPCEIFKKEQTFTKLTQLKL